MSVQDYKFEVVPRAYSRMTDGSIHGFKHTGFLHFIMYLRLVSVISLPRQSCRELNRLASQLEYFISVTKCIPGTPSDG